MVRSKAAATAATFERKPTRTNGSKHSATPSNAKAAPVKQTLADTKEGDNEDEQYGSQDDNDDDDEDEDDEEIQEGLERLMKALGDDGLSEMDMAHLNMVTANGAGYDEENSEEDDEDDEENGEDDADDDEEEEEEDGVEEQEEDEADAKAPIANTSKNDSLAASIARSGLVAEEEFSEDEEDEEDDEDDEDDERNAIPMESLSDAALAALPESVRARRMYREKINNEDALRRIREDIALSGGSSGKPSMAWIETLVVAYDKSIQNEVGTDADAAEDDLKRELAFYKQAAHAAVQGKHLAQQANLPFSRPSDFFAEMVKSDEHMERVRQRLLDERAGLKASEDARKQRELKKFGKKVQVEKQLERQRSKRQFEEEVKGMKRKRGGLDGGRDDDDGGADDEFDVRLESAMASDAGARRGDGPRGRGRGRGRGGKPTMKRDARDSKFGFGGKKRHAKENTRESTNDFGGSGGGRGRGGGLKSRGRGGSSRGGAKRGGSSSRGRPGKARRASGGRG